MRLMKLSEICDVYDGIHITPEYKKSGIPFRTVENLYDEKVEKYISKEFYDKNYKNKKIEKNSIYISRIGSIGNIKYLNPIEEAYYVTLALLTNIQIDPLYMSYCLQSSYFQKELYRNSLLDAFPSKINMNDLKKCKLVIHEENEIQIKIGSFFKELDELIELEENNKDNLSQLKMGIIQLYKNKSSKVVKLSNFINIEKNGIKESECINNTMGKNVWDASLRPCLYSNINLSDSAYIGFVKDGSCGKFTICPKHSTVLSTMIKLFPKNININLLELILHTIHFDKYMEGSTIKHIYPKDLLNINVPIINDDELADKFNEAYVLIKQILVLYEDLLDNLDLIKKYFLQKMFVY